MYIENYAKVNKRSWKQDVYCLGILGKFFGSSCLREINSFKIERFKAVRLNERISKSRVNRYLALLKKMFNLAIDWGYLEENSMRKVKLFSEQENVKERILSLNEEARLLHTCSKHLKPIILTALNTGMRRGEILNLRWNQIDFSKRIIRIEKTKSGKIRFIPINEVVLCELSGLKRKTCNSDYVFLFPKTGQPIKDVKTAFNSAKRRAGVKGIRFHDLRYTFASRLIERGADIVTVQNLLGHQSLSTTQRYTHSSSMQKRRAIESLSHKGMEIPAFVPVLSTKRGEYPQNALFSSN